MRFRWRVFLILSLVGLIGFAVLAARAAEETPKQKPAEARQKKTDEIAREAEKPDGWMADVDVFFGNNLVKPLAKVLFFDFWSNQWLRTSVPEEVKCENEDCEHKFAVADVYPDDVPIVFPCPKCEEEIKTGTSVPLVVLWLLFGAIFFTLRMGFINIRGFWHAIRVTKGDYDKPGEEGEVSHFQALASALSATVGLGNIAGVAIAVSLGGPGATFWLVVAGLLGMSTKFAECTLGQLYRKVDADGVVSGGPMHYLKDGLTDMGMKPLGAVLAGVFVVVCMGGSFGGGCVFQVSQSLEALNAELLNNKVTFLDKYPWIYGVALAAAVGVVIIGGIQRIAATAERIVPLMCTVYVATALYILLAKHAELWPAIRLIVDSAFSPSAAYGGFVGVLVTGIRRAAFSNEAGLGSASIAHAAAKTDEPVSEGIVALLEPFIDTVVVCTMTGLVIVVTGVYDAGALSKKCTEHSDVTTCVQCVGDEKCAEHIDAEKCVVCVRAMKCAGYIDAEKGAPLTAEAFRSVITWFPWILTIAVMLFAYSTMISWSYYGERCWSHLFGDSTAIIYKLIFLCFIVLGSIVSASNIVTFSDLMILSMAFPNILGVMLLSGKVRRALKDYWRRLKSGEIAPVRK